MFLPWMILFVVPWLPCQSSPGTVWWKFWFEWRLYQRQFYDTEIDTELGWHWCGRDSLHVRFVWQPSCIDNWGPIGLDTTDWMAWGIGPAIQCWYSHYAGTLNIRLVMHLSAFDALPQRSINTLRCDAKNTASFMIDSQRIMVLFMHFECRGEGR